MQSEEKDTRPDWKLLILRLMAGGYLIYLAYRLLNERGLSSGAVYLLGPAVFFIMGLAFGGWAVVRLIRGEFRH